MHVNVIIEQSVVDKINTAIYRFPDMETGGQLIGSIGKDAITGSYTVYVADLYHEISQVGTGSGFTFLPSYQSNAYFWCDKTYGGKLHIIGNFHSHANFPAFWSKTDDTMMRQLKGEALYIVASPSEGSWLFRFKDDEFDFSDDCRVTIAGGGSVDTAIGKELIESPYTRPEGSAAVQYTAIPHYTVGQTKELAKRFDYAVDALHDKRVLLIGAGTIGNLMLESLVLSGVGRITIVDTDTYQIANLPRSPMVSRSALGQPKAFALAKAAAEKACFPLMITGIKADICKLGFGFLESFDLVISVVDSMAVRQFIDRGCKIYDTAHISAGTGLLQSGFFGNVMFSPPGTHIDYAQMFGSGWRAHEEKKRSCAEYEDTTQPQVLAFSSRIAGLASDLALKWLLGRMADKKSVRKYVLKSAGEAVETDAASFQLVTYREPSEAAESCSELFSRLGKLPTHFIRFDRREPKSGLYRLFRREFGDESESYQLDLENLAMVLPVVYCNQSVASVNVCDVDIVDEVLFRLPPRHVYSVFTEDSEYLVELTFADAV
jgi:molybdopterin/thiamine biosynthesis adenylyltransferase/proteasome lid subunit RPN8/RPN11